MSKDKRYQTNDLADLPDNLEEVPTTKTEVVAPPPQPAQKQQPVQMPKPMPQADYISLKDRLVDLLEQVNQIREKIEVQDGIINAIKALESSVTEGQAKVNETLVAALTRLVDAEARRAEAAEAARTAAQERQRMEQLTEPEAEPEGFWAKVKAWWNRRAAAKARERRHRAADAELDWQLSHAKKLEELRKVADGPASLEGVEASEQADILEEEIKQHNEARKKADSAA